MCLVWFRFHPTLQTALTRTCGDPAAFSRGKVTESTIGTLSLDLITCQPVRVRSTTSDHRQGSSGLHRKDPFINHCPVPRPGVVLSDKTYETRFASVWVPRPQFSRHLILALINLPPPDRSLCTTLSYRHRPRDIDHWFLIHAKSANHANISYRNPNTLMHTPPGTKEPKDEYRYHPALGRAKRVLTRSTPTRTGL